MGHYPRKKPLMHHRVRAKQNQRIAAQMPRVPAYKRKQLVPYRSKHEQKKLLHSLLSKYAKKAVPPSPHKPRVVPKKHFKKAHREANRRPLHFKIEHRHQEQPKKHYQEAQKILKNKTCPKPVDFGELLPIVLKQQAPASPKAHAKRVDLHFADLSPIFLKESEKKLMRGSTMTGKKAMEVLAPLSFTKPTTPHQVNLQDMKPLDVNHPGQKNVHQVNLKDMKPVELQRPAPAQKEGCQSLKLSVITPLKVDSLEEAKKKSQDECKSKSKTPAFGFLEPVDVNHERKASCDRRSTNLKILKPLDLDQLPKATGRPAKPLTSVQKFLLSLQKERGEEGSIALFSKDGHLSMPDRLNRYLKLLIGRENRKRIRKHPYKPHDPYDLVLKYGNRPSYEIDRLSRYLDRRRRRLLARRVRKAKEQKRRELEKLRKKVEEQEKLKDERIRQAQEEEKKREALKLQAEKLKKSGKSTSNSPSSAQSVSGTKLARAGSHELSLKTDMIESIKQAVALEHGTPYTALHI